MTDKALNKNIHESVGPELAYLAQKWDKLTDAEKQLILKLLGE